jgi:hypothetical protein
MDGFVVVAQTVVDCKHWLWTPNDRVPTSHHSTLHRGVPFSQHPLRLQALSGRARAVGVGHP